MASVVSSERTDEGVKMEIEAGYEEYLHLEGHMDNIHIFAEKQDAVDTRISQRGKNGATKYFLIPRNMRKGFDLKNAISCYRIDKNNSILFVYHVDKLGFDAGRDLE